MTDPVTEDTDAPQEATEVRATEVRILEGPNLYSTRPVAKVALDITPLLYADAPTSARLSALAGVRGGRPGAAGTQQRQRWAGRVAERVVRRLATASGTGRLGVRTRASTAVEEVVVAFVWRRRGRARALGEAVAPTLQRWVELARSVGEDGDDDGYLAVAAERAVTEAALDITRAEPGDRPMAGQPPVPVASITGTNGKTTTTRLLAHLCMTAGLTTAWSSTDGVVAMGEMVEPGDYSGPAGARAVLATPGLQIGILETARGGMLLRGMGVSVNDVSVVTNVSADHLGMQGIDTLDQLAEVKAIITRVTKPQGWTVLNGDDPRVWPMRMRSKARPWAFSLDPASPSLREATVVGGRGITVMDGQLTVLLPDGEVDRLVDVLDVPITLSGLSPTNTANALAATAAALGLGIPRDSVVAGLRTFVPDDRLNPGRMNCYTVPLEGGGAATVIIDLAHNEAGLEALTAAARGLVVPGGRILLGLGLAGDRTDDLLETMGELAGLRAEHVEIVHKSRYLRGRSTEEMESLLRAGLARAGVADVPVHPDEPSGARSLVAAAADGDVVALMVHEQRAEVADWLVGLGGTADDARAVRAKVVRARGQHELEAEIEALWASEDEAGRVDTARTWVEQHPGDPRLRFEYAGALDSAGLEAQAAPEYEQALDAGLREPWRHRALIQLASTLRLLGRPQEALTRLDEVASEHHDGPSTAAFRALVLRDLGRGDEAVAGLVEALLGVAGDADTLAYQRALREYAGRLR